MPTELKPFMTVDWINQNMHRQTLQTSRGSMALEPSNHTSTKMTVNGSHEVSRYRYLGDSVSMSFAARLKPAEREQRPKCNFTDHVCERAVTTTTTVR